MDEKDMDISLEQLIDEDEMTDHVQEHIRKEYGHNKKAWLHSAYELMGNLAVALILVTVVFSFCFRQVVVDGDSMNDTLANQDRLVLQTTFYEVERGDIVVIYQKDRPEKPLIKRVIALGGDSLCLEPENNQVKIKKAGEDTWQVLEEPYVKYPLTYGVTWTSDKIVTVPKDSVFVMGDHRNNSSDSRSIGYIEEENIVGRVMLRVYPLTDFGLV